MEDRRVWREPYHGVVMVAGHEEVLAVLRDTASFSNVNIVAGPTFRFPVELTAHRALLMGLITLLVIADLLHGLSQLTVEFS